jgi:thiamine biosynthesis lipoprotein
MGASEPGGPVTDSFRAMGSDVSLVVDGSAHHAESARLILADLEKRWSRFLPDSDTSRLNTQSGWVEVTPETISLFTHARTAWETTGGVFDPTILPSLVLAGYRESRSENPGATVLPHPGAVGRSPGMDRIRIDEDASRIHVPDGIAFDPGGIGKGLAADIVATSLVAAGARAVMVSVGGDVRVAGVTPALWSVEVENPFDPDATIAELRLRDGGVCTSSVRAKRWEAHGRPAHHIIDPATGRPAETTLVSATVITGDAWMAEALCKATIMSEPLDALDFCEAHGVEAILVDHDGVIWRTKHIDRLTA